MLVQKWLLVLLIFFGVPLAVVWVATPFMDVDRGTYLAAQKEYIDAIKHFDRAIKMNSGLASAYSKRGWVYDKTKHPDKALLDFNHAIMLNDSMWDPYNNRAWLYLELGQLDKAVADANQAIQLCQTCPYPYDTRGVAYLKMNQYDRALADFTRAIELKPYYGAAFYHRAQCEAALGKKEQADSDLHDAQDLGYSGS